MIGGVTLLFSLGLLTACDGDGDNEEPSVAITSHADGEEISEGLAVTFVASVADDQDAPGDLQGLWTTTDDRELCAPTTANDQGELSCETVLAEGEDSVTLTVTDSEGAKGSDTVAVTLVLTEAPTAVILEPEDGATTYSNVTLSLAGQVSDTEDTADALTTWWESSLDGELIGLGGVPDEDGLVNDGSVLSAGEHTLTLWVEDSSEKQGSDSISVTVQEDNTAPTCSITAPENGTTGKEGDSVTFEASLEDAESTPETLAVVWESDLDGELFNGFGGSEGTSSLTTTALTLGTHVVTLTVTDDSGASWALCTDEVLFTVGDPPLVSLVSPTDGSVYDEGDGVLFSAEVSDGTDDANRLELSWTSDLDGEFNTDDAPLVGLAEFTEDGLTSGDHVVTLRATDSDGLYGEDSVTLTVNGLPTAPTVSITPDPATTVDDLVAVIDVESTDPEGDTVTYSYTWTVDGSSFAGSTTETISTADTTQGETWTVEVLPSDSTSPGASGTASITIDNSPPELSAVSLTPDPAYQGDTFTCTPDTASDTDGDSVTYATSWTIDGTLLSTSRSTLDDSYWSKNQEVFCTVTPWDPMDAGTPVDSNTVVVSNSLPTIDGVAISPEDPAIDDTLTCSYTGFADGDSDADSSTFLWTIDGTEVGTTSTLSGVFAPGDTTLCTVTPDDGQDTGTPLSASVVVANTPPELDSVSLTPDPAYEDDTLACTPGTASDVDGHTVTTTYSWTVSGTDPGVTDSTLSGDDFDKDDDVSCTVTPNDGNDDGNPVTSNTVTILNTPPVLSDVVLGPEPATAGDTLTCTPDSTLDADGDSVTLSYAWTVDGSPVSVTDDTLDDSHWTRHQEVICSVTPSDGTDDGTAVDSNAVTITNSAPSIESVTITPEDPEVEDTLTCSHSGFSDADGDSDQSTYEWTLGGSVVGASTTLSGVFGSGDIVTCTVTPHDGADTGTPVSTDVIVANTPPEIADATLTPTTAYEEDTLLCTPGATSDADGHTVSTTYAWTVSGNDPGVTTDTLSGDDFDKDDTVTCTVTPNDGADDGASVDSNTVTVSNSAPVIATVSLDPDPAYEGDSLTCTPDTATDADNDSVSTTLSWTVSGNSLSHSEDTLDDSNWTRGDEVVCSATPDDGIDSGSTTDSNTVTIANSAPTITGVSITPSDPEVADTLTCSIDGFSDADEDSDQSTYSWTIDGTEVGTDSTLSGAFAAGEEVTCTVTPSDGTDDGTADSNSVQIANSLPVLDSVSLTPLSAYEGDTFTCTEGTATDADDHAISYSYAWNVSGNDPGVTDSELGPDDFSGGDQVACTVTPNDGYDDGDSVTSNTVTVGNTAPVLDEVTLSPDPAYESSTLTCAPGSASDADGDSISYAYEWTISGSGISATSSTLSGDKFKKDDTVSCTVTPYDSSGSGLAVDSNTLTIENTAPTLSSVSISPSDPLLDDTLTCTTSGFDDDDGDSDQSTYSWTIDGTEVGTDTTLSGAFAAGDEVTCTVTPYDGTDTGTSANDSVVVENTPPELDSVTLTPLTAYEGDTFTCTPGTATDADDHTISYSYAWIISGSNPGVTDSELGPDYFGSGDQVVCHVTPSDGHDDGVTVASNTVTVGNTAPVLDDVTLSPDPAYEGSTLTCSPGSTSDADGDSISYAYEWTVSGSGISATSSTLTGDKFKKDDTVSCTVTPYDSSGSGLAVDSNTLTIENTAPTITSVSISPSAPQVDDTLTCSVSGFSDDDGDSDQSTYSWTLDGTEVSVDSSVSGGTFLTGDQVTCTVTPYDGTDTGTAVSDSVTVANTPPELDSVTLSPSTVYEGDTLTCTPGTATDVDGDSVSYSYDWKVNSSTLSSHDSELSSDYWGRNDDVACIVTPSDGTDDGDAVSSNTVTVSNTAPELDSITLSPDPAFEGDSLDCDPDSATDVDGDSISYLYSWTVDGLAVSSTSSSLTSSFFAKSDEVYCTASPTDGTDTGVAVDSNTVTIENTAPSISSVSIDLSNPTVSETLVCSYSGYSDADGDSDQSTYEWTIDGSTVGTSESLSGVFDSGDTVTCTVTPYDGTDTGSTMSAQVNIGNTIPVLDTVSLTPTTAYEGDTLTCTPSSLDDDDGDSITYGYQWTVNSWDPGVSDNELNSSHWSRDNEVFCTVTPYDGSEYGAPVSSNTVTISNTVPEITSVTVSPSSPTTNESLTASVSTHDEDGDSVSVSYVWLVDGSPASGAFGNTLSGETYFDKHQEIAVEVTPSDNEGAGTSATSDSVTAVNSAPGPPQVNINPNSAEPGVDELVCRVDLDSEDDDDDSISYSFSWQVEDQDYPDEFSSAAGPTTTTFTDDTVPAEDTTLGDHWSCIVVPNDGEDDGEAGTGVAQVLNLVNVGNDVVFSGTDFLGQDELRGGSLNVSQNGTLHRLAMLTPETSGNVKMALYTDSSGGPDTLVIGTESTALNGGTLEIEVGAAPINAGSYWLLAVYDQSTTVYDDPGSTSPTVFQGMPFSQSFKSNFGPYTSNAGQEFNYYLVMEEE